MKIVNSHSWGIYHPLFISSPSIIYHLGVAPFMETHSWLLMPMAEHADLQTWHALAGPGVPARRLRQPSGGALQPNKMERVGGNSALGKNGEKPMVSHGFKHWRRADFSPPSIPIPHPPPPHHPPPHPVTERSPCCSGPSPVAPAPRRRTRSKAPPPRRWGNWPSPDDERKTTRRRDGDGIACGKHVIYPKMVFFHSYVHVYQSRSDKPIEMPQMFGKNILF